MLYSWKNGFTVEPSWIFIQSGVFYGVIIAILSEILTTLKWEIVETKNSVDPVDSKKIQ